ncbi:hypothetical protein T492DRAFT_857945 [Pavlovales sp. CCMP2436]|nr:hypothetical protein T492DRAFT_857945 [Pavlovales sp. CCMP2436]
MSSSDIQHGFGILRNGRVNQPHNDNKQRKVLGIGSLDGQQQFLDTAQRALQKLQLSPSAMVTEDVITMGAGGRCLALTIDEFQDKFNAQKNISGTLANNYDAMEELCSAVRKYGNDLQRAAEQNYLLQIDEYKQAHFSAIGRKIPEPDDFETVGAGGKPTRSKGQAPSTPSSKLTGDIPPEYRPECSEWLAKKTDQKHDAHAIEITVLEAKTATSIHNIKEKFSGSCRTYTSIDGYAAKIYDNSIKILLSVLQDTMTQNEFGLLSVQAGSASDGAVAQFHAVWAMIVARADRADIQFALTESHGFFFDSGNLTYASYEELWGALQAAENRHFALKIPLEHESSFRKFATLMRHMPDTPQINTLLQDMRQRSYKTFDPYWVEELGSKLQSLGLANTIRFGTPMQLKNIDRREYIDRRDTERSLQSRPAERTAARAAKSAEADDINVESTKAAAVNSGTPRGILRPPARAPTQPSSRPSHEQLRGSHAPPPAPELCSLCAREGVTGKAAQHSHLFCNRHKCFNCGRFGIGHNAIECPEPLRVRRPPGPFRTGNLGGRGGSGGTARPASAIYSKVDPTNDTTVDYPVDSKDNETMRNMLRAFDDVRRKYEFPLDTWDDDYDVLETHARVAQVSTSGDEQDGKYVTLLIDTGCKGAHLFRDGEGVIFDDIRRIKGRVAWGKDHTDTTVKIAGYATDATTSLLSGTKLMDDGAVLHFEKGNSYICFGKRGGPRLAVSDDCTCRVRIPDQQPRHPPARAPHTTVSFAASGN